MPPRLHRPSRGQLLQLLAFASIGAGAVLAPFPPIEPAWLDWSVRVACFLLGILAVDALWTVAGWDTLDIR